MQEIINIASQNEFEFQSMKLVVPTVIRRTTIANTNAYHNALNRRFNINNKTPHPHPKKKENVGSVSNPNVKKTQNEIGLAMDEKKLAPTHKKLPSIKPKETEKLTSFSKTATSTTTAMSTEQKGNESEDEPISQRLSKKKQHTHSINNNNNNNNTNDNNIPKNNVRSNAVGTFTSNHQETPPTKKKTNNKTSSQQSIQSHSSFHTLQFTFQYCQ